MKDVMNFEDNLLEILWNSSVPGSGAPEHLMVGAVQAAGNKGLDVTEAANLLHEGLEALNQRKLRELNMLTSLLLEKLDTAKKDPRSIYWNFEQVNSWEQHHSLIKKWPSFKVDFSSKDFEDRILAAWLGQICGGAFGTPIEGFTSDKIFETLGSPKTYARTPNTYNDDITYEIAFLEAYSKKGHGMTSKDIAAEWIGLIPFGWSAELVALKNIKLGIFPPESGSRTNPFSEWIGAQMRGAIVGMVSPGNLKEAARLAWTDGLVSHTGNGILGEVFNALMCSLAFVAEDIREMLISVISLLPSGTQYYSVVKSSLDLCRESDDWRSAWKICEEKYKEYNWVHSYPNAAAEIIGLWYGNGDFDKTMEIIAGCGLDVDCNAAQAGAILGIFGGVDIIPSKWVDPIGDVLETYLRGMERLSIKKLSEKTVLLVRTHNIQ